MDSCISGSDVLLNSSSTTVGTTNGVSITVESSAILGRSRRLGAWFSEAVKVGVGSTKWLVGMPRIV